MTGAADEYALEKHDRQQTVFTLSGEVCHDAHRGHERDVAEDMVADLHVLRWYDGKGPLRIGCPASLRCGGLNQCLDFRSHAPRIQDGTIASGIELQQNRLFSGAGEMDGNDQPFHEWQFILRMLRADKGNAFAAYTFAHRTGLVQTEQFVPVVHKQVEVSEKTLAEDAPNARIGGLNRSEV